MTPAKKSHGASRAPKSGTRSVPVHVHLIEYITINPATDSTEKLLLALGALYGCITSETTATERIIKDELAARSRGFKATGVQK